MKTLTERLGSIENRIDDMESDLNENIANLAKTDSKIQKCNETMKNLSKQFETTADEVKDYRASYFELDSKFKSLLEKHLALDTYNRKENLLFHGIPGDKEENCQATIRNVLKTKMNISPPTVDSIVLHRCHRLGDKANVPIMCRFASFQDRELVWNAKSALKGTKIYITEHFASEIEERRRLLYPVYRAALQKKMKASMHYDKIKINGTFYSSKNLHTLPTELNATHSKNGVTCFFSGASPLSNFHMASFTLHGNTYDCVERYLQMAKAQYAEKPHEVVKIKEAAGPVQCKGIGDAITVDNEDEWLAEAKRVTYQACRAKFTQNDHCKQVLLATGQDALAEAGPNQVWGIGLRINDDNAYDKCKWNGQNVLGELLTQLRNELTEI